MPFMTRFVVAFLCLLSAGTASAQDASTPFEAPSRPTTGGSISRPAMPAPSFGPRGETEILRHRNFAGRPCLNVRAARVRTSSIASSTITSSPLRTLARNALRSASATTAQTTVSAWKYPAASEKKLSLAHCPRSRNLVSSFAKSSKSDGGRPPFN